MSTRPSSIKDIVEFAHDDIKYPVIRVIGRFGSPFHPLYMRIERNGFYLQNDKLSGMLPKL